MRARDTLAGLPFRDAAKRPPAHVPCSQPLMYCFCVGGQLVDA